MIIDNKYELKKVLGQGGFGIVWLARNIHTGEPVALKILQLSSDEQSDLKARERFMREIQIALILQHPHVLSALDYGYISEGGTSLPYLVSPYIPDGSLAEVIAGTPPWEHWTLLQTADVILQAAQGLHYLHTREPKIVHQDVKPANFLIRWEHKPERIVHVYLSDFGISRWLRTSDDKTGQVVGTLIYLAPEQLDGNITWTSDQYSLAIIAHLLLTGSRPTRDASSERDSSWLLPSQLNPQRIPSPAIDEILLKALKYNPRHRFPSVLAFAEALYNAITQAKRSSAEPTEADVRHHSNDLTAKGGYTSHQQAQPASSPPDEKLPPIDLETEDQGKPPVATPPQATPPPPTEGQKGKSAPLPVLSLNQLWSRDLSALPNTLCWSRGGKSLVFTFYGEAPPIVLNRDGKMEMLSDLKPARLACWAPEGRVLACSSPQQGVRLWDMDNPAQQALTLLIKNRSIEGLDWSLQRQLAVWIEGQILIYTLPSRLPDSLTSFVPQTLTHSDLHGGSSSVLRWSPDGTLLAAGTYKGMVICWEAQTHTVQWQEPASNTLVYSLAWSPDSTKLAVAFSNRRVAVWDIIKKQKVGDWRELPIVPRMLSISRDQRLVIASNTGELLFGSIDDSMPTATHPGHWLVAWSPTRPELATLDAQKETELILWSE